MKKAASCSFLSLNKFLLHQQKDFRSLTMHMIKSFDAEENHLHSWDEEGKFELFVYICSPLH